MKKIDFTASPPLKGAAADIPFFNSGWYLVSWIASS